MKCCRLQWIALLATNFILLFQDRSKPGRQIVTFLLICNLAIWVIYTFEVQKVEESPVQVDQYYARFSWNGSIIDSAHIYEGGSICYRLKTDATFDLMSVICFRLNFSATNHGWSSRNWLYHCAYSSDSTALSHWQKFGKILTKQSWLTSPQRNSQKAWTPTGDFRRILSVRIRSCLREISILP